MVGQNLMSFIPKVKSPADSKYYDNTLILILQKPSLKGSVPDNKDQIADMLQTRHRQYEDLSSDESAE